MTLKFNALNIFILILYRILDFYFLDFCIARIFLLLLWLLLAFQEFFYCN